MSDMSFEAPDADAEEQHQEVLPADDGDEAEAGEPGRAGEAAETPLEADEADRAEQSRVVAVDDDDYR